ncbi:MAG TPA: alpha/beta fold hydrolase [Chthonomonadaceae bacterium]|nr:alpha/beta fold hydrolase [Chthonomonadaceae bacterium]
MPGRIDVYPVARRAQRLPVAALLLAATLAGPATGCSHAGLSSSDAEKGAGVKEVHLKTADGWTVVGDLYAPPGKSHGAVVLLHQRGGSAADWRSLCTALQKAGIIALAIDQRGAGRSTEGPGPTGQDAPWPTSPDIAAAIASLKDKGPISLAGASYGANNALIYAAAHPDQVKGLALFSPGANYHGLNALAPAHAYHGPVVIYHDRGDSIADGGPQEIDQALASRDHTLRIYSGSDHGTALLDPAVVRDAVTFFKRVLK